MPPAARKGSGEKQTEYESDTQPHELGFANKASRIFGFHATPVNIITKSSACWASPWLKQGLADHPSDKR